MTNEKFEMRNGKSVPVYASAITDVEALLPRESE